MRTTVLVATLWSATAVRADTGVDEVLRLIREGDIRKAKSALEKIEPTPDAAARVAAAALDGPMCDPRVEKYTLDPRRYGVRSPDVTIWRLSWGAAVQNFVEKAHAGAQGPGLAYLDAMMVAYRSLRVGGEAPAADDIVAVAEAYVQRGGPEHATALGRAIKALRWARTLPDANARKLLEREKEIADKGRAIAPDAALFRLAGLTERLKKARRSRTKLQALLEDTATLAEAPDADLAVLRFHRELVTRAREARLDAPYVTVEHEVLPRVKISTPRGIAWRSRTLQRHTGYLVCYDPDGNPRYELMFSDTVSSKENIVEEVATRWRERLERELDTRRVRRPRRIELTGKIDGLMIAAAARGEAGNRFRFRVYVLGTPAASATRVVIVRLRSVGAKRIDDPELDAVLASLEYRPRTTSASTVSYGLVLPAR